MLPIEFTSFQSSYPHYFQIEGAALPLNFTP
jgi:hypothetical protein